MARKIKVSQQLDDALKDYRQVIIHFLTKDSSGDYCTFIRSIENDMAQANPNFSLLNDWIFPELNNKKDTSTNTSSNNSTFGNYVST